MSQDSHYLSTTLSKVSAEFSEFSEIDVVMTPDDLRAYSDLFQILARLAVSIEESSHLLEILVDHTRVAEILNRHISPDIIEDLAKDLLSEKGTMQ